MKDKIHNLITRQLGPEMDAIKIRPTDRNHLEFMLKQETEKRELLAGLIDETYAYVDMDITDRRTYPALEVKPGIMPWIERFERNTKLIEKSLSMKWLDIVQYLEGEG